MKMYNVLIKHTLSFKVIDPDSWDQTKANNVKEGFLIPSTFSTHLGVMAQVSVLKSWFDTNQTVRNVKTCTIPWWKESGQWEVRTPLMGLWNGTATLQSLQAPEKSPPHSEAYGCPRKQPTPHVSLRRQDTCGRGWAQHPEVPDSVLQSHFSGGMECCYGLNCVSLNSCVEVLTPNVTVFGDGVFSNEV